MQPYRPAELDDPSRMQAMFSTISPRYDFITRMFSFGMDRGWKQRGIEDAHLPEAARVLDLACGTADFSRMAAKVRPGGQFVGLDLTFPMLQFARKAGLGSPVNGNAMALPFPDDTFDAVFVGYGLRNFPDLPRTLSEIRRVLRPGGRLVCLDFFLPKNPLLRELFLGYMFVQGAFWGAVLHGQPSVYTYIPKSLRHFVTAKQFDSVLEEIGLHTEKTRQFVLGGIGVHTSRRTPEASPGQRLAGANGGRLKPKAGYR